MGGGVAPEYGPLVSPAMDSIGAGVVVAIEDGAGLGEAASPTTTPVTPTTDLEKSEADGEGVAASAGRAPRADTPELAAPASAPMRTTARPSIRSRIENLRKRAAPRNPIDQPEQLPNPSSEKKFVPPGDSLARRRAKALMR